MISRTQRSNVIGKHILGEGCNQVRLDIYWDRKCEGAIIGILLSGNHGVAESFMNDTCSKLKARDYMLVLLTFSQSAKGKIQPGIAGYMSPEASKNRGRDYAERIGPEHQYFPHQVASEREKDDARSFIYLGICTQAAAICKRLNEIPDTSPDPTRPLESLWKVGAFKSQHRMFKAIYKAGNRFSSQHPTDIERELALSPTNYPAYFLPIDGFMADILSNAGEVVIWVDKSGYRQFVSIADLITALPLVAIEATHGAACVEMFSERELIDLRKITDHVFWTIFETLMPQYKLVPLQTLSLVSRSEEQVES